MVKEKNGNRTKARPSKEELLERRVKMAKERGSRVVKINSPLGNIMFNVLRQFDQAYLNFKGRIGEPGGISFEEGAELMDRAGKISLEFSELTKDLSEKVRFKYYAPDELKAFSVEKSDTKHQDKPINNTKKKVALEMEA
jgi:hypothetical protein